MGERNVVRTNFPGGPLPYPEYRRLIGQASTPQPRVRRDASDLRDLSSRRQNPRCALESGLGIEPRPETCDVHTPAYVECDPERDGIARDATGTIQNDLRRIPGS